MLAVNNIEVMFHNVILVISGVSLEVGDRQIVCLLGANGAGKSTTIKAISGMLRPEDGAVTGGDISFNGHRIDKSTTEEIARLGVTVVQEGHRILEHLTVEENLLVGAYIINDRAQVKRDLASVFQYFPRLKDLRNKVSGWCSGGEQQMLVMGRAMMAHPKLILMDEPSMGLSPILTREIFYITVRINQEEKVAVLVVEQNARAALDIAEYGYVMESGRVVLNSAAKDLRENEDIKEFYLGLSTAGVRRSFREVKHYKRRKRWL
jgi:branched-chain amino acid transport system ATP-binding protein